MSRSGTSLLAHVLHALGATLPNDLMGAGHGNPLGHFEPKALVALNDRILESLGRRWDDPRPIPARWFRSRQAYRFMRRIIGQIRQSYGDAPILVIKDPRLCRLLPLYLEALDVLDIEPLVILQMRPVAEVVRSLGDRDGMQPGLAEFLWLRSVSEAEVQSRGCRRVWTSMGEIMTDWPDAMRRITDGLALKWPMERHEAIDEIGPLLKPHLCHGVASEPFEATMPRFSTATWAAVEHGLAGDEPAARAAFDAVRAALIDLDKMHGNYLSALAAMRKPLSWRLSTPLRALRRLR
ncbi:sulfotransferase family protein [Acidisphaera sp. S103]|uniref:sulfotransferase family protein n=1 Tax=Acidisphaera sp. S103 TaxID=1747223 RepID=UPI00131AE371|nr:hypothetical protein [Acidisphaera sp. S103]